MSTTVSPALTVFAAFCTVRHGALWLPLPLSLPFGAM
jgi:hypothetical protein